MTVYNQCVHENKDDDVTMASWSQSWQVLPESEKLQYNSRASEFQPECDKKKKSSAMLKKLGKCSRIF